MRRNLLGLAVGAVASVLVGSIAVAQSTEEITVVGTRTVEKEVGHRTPMGARIMEISLSYGVSYADLDLTSYAGASELTKRVQDTSMAACKEISQQYPRTQLTPDDDACAKTAADKAMIAVQERLAAAAKKSAK